MHTLRDYKKCLWAIPLALLVNIGYFAPSQDAVWEGELNDLFLRALCDIQTYEGRDHAILVLSFMSMAFLLIFSILCGMDIYKEMYSTGIYVMTRVKNKYKWIGSLIAALAGKAFVFSIAYAATTWIIMWWCTGVKPDKKSPLAFLLAVAFLFFTVFLITLIMNYLSIRFQTRIGVFGGTAVLLFMVMYILFYEYLPIAGLKWDLRFLDPLYMLNLYYDGGSKVAIVLCYYLVLFVSGIIYFIKKVESLDVKIINEDI